MTASAYPRATVRPLRFSAGGGGHWITIEEDGIQTHIFIGGGGVVTKGPKSLIGANIKHLPPGPSRSVTHHPEGHTPQGATSHPSYTEHQAPEKKPGRPYAREHGAPQTRQEQGPEPLSEEQAKAGLAAAKAELKPAEAKPGKNAVFWAAKTRAKHTEDILKEHPDIAHAYRASLSPNQTFERSDHEKAVKAWVQNEVARRLTPEERGHLQVGEPKDLPKPGLARARAEAAPREQAKPDDSFTKRQSLHQSLGQHVDTALQTNYDKRQAREALDHLKAAYEGYDKAGGSFLSAGIAGKRHDQAKDIAQRLLTSSLSTGGPKEVAFSRALHHLANDDFKSSQANLTSLQSAPTPAAAVTPASGTTLKPTAPGEGGIQQARAEAAHTQRTEAGQTAQHDLFGGKTVIDAAKAKAKTAEDAQMAMFKPVLGGGMEATNAAKGNPKHTVESVAEDWRRHKADVLRENPDIAEHISRVEAEQAKLDHNTSAGRSQAARLPDTSEHEQWVAQEARSRLSPEQRSVAKVRDSMYERYPKPAVPAPAPEASDDEVHEYRASLRQRKAELKDIRDFIQFKGGVAAPKQIGTHQEMRRAEEWKTLPDWAKAKVGQGLPHDIMAQEVQERHPHLSLEGASDFHNYLHEHERERKGIEAELANLPNAPRRSGGGKLSADTMAQMRQRADAFEPQFEGDVGFSEETDSAMGDAPYWFRDYSQAERDEMPDSDFAGPHESYPIRSQADVHNAARLIGHADDPEAVKARIIAIARRKGFALPESWGDHKQADEPTASDVHLNSATGVVGTPRPKRSHMLHRLVQRIRARFKEGPAISADMFEEDVRHALGHAGGLASAESRRSAMAEPLSDGDEYADPDAPQDFADPDPLLALAEEWGLTEDDALAMAEADDAAEMPEDDDTHAQHAEVAHVYAESGEGFRLFLPAQFAEAPGRIPYLPRPGTFSHPKYGKLSITRDRNREFVTNFNAGVYQKQIPLDAEHQTKLSGAMGWVQELMLNEDGSADARVEWTDRGRKLLADNRFKYVSPEWYDSWPDPASDQVHKNVVIGGALTTRPYFKESALRPLVASEHGYLTLGDDNPFAPCKETSVNQTYTEEDIQSFAERIATLEAERAQAIHASEAAAAEARQAAERVAVLETANRRKAFAETARDWPGDVNGHVQFMEDLPSDEMREWYITQQRALTEQLKDSALFKQMGRTGGADEASAQGKADALAKARQASKGISYALAFTEVMEENPNLYEQMEAEKARR